MFFMSCDGISHAGTAKATNEDRFLIADIRPTTSFRKTNLDVSNDAVRSGRSLGNLMIVSDGSGDPDDAARASTLAVDSLVQSLMNDFHWTPPLDSIIEKAIEDQMLAAFWRCQQTIVREAKVLDDSRRADMSASVALAWVSWPHLLLATAGNCRAMLVRNGTLQFMTEDDAAPLSELDRSERTGSEALDDAGDNVLTNLVGGLSKRLSPTIRFLQLEKRDSLLLCTDGVTGVMSTARMVEILASPVSATGACDAIVNESLRVSGNDNVTVIVAKLEELKQEQSAEAFAAATLDDGETPDEGSALKKGATTVL